jgi:hypothetical protein
LQIRAELRTVFRRVGLIQLADRPVERHQPAAERIVTFDCAQRRAPFDPRAVNRDPPEGIPMGGAAQHDRGRLRFFSSLWP